MRKVIIYGGNGALGSKCVHFFKLNNWWTSSIGHAPNSYADENIVVIKELNLLQQEHFIEEKLSKLLGENKVDAIICVTGGWSAGNATKSLVRNSLDMWQKSMWGSLIASSLATKFLKEGGLLSLTGAKVALKETPNMIAYNVSKSAVHSLTNNLAAQGSGLPKDAVTVAILPDILDTPVNGKWMPSADFSCWTPLSFVAEMFLKWCNGEDRPPNGSLLQLITKDFATTIVPVQ